MSRAETVIDQESSIEDRLSLLFRECLSSNISQKDLLRKCREISSNRKDAKKIFNQIQVSVLIKKYSNNEISFHNFKRLSSKIYPTKRQIERDNMYYEVRRNIISNYLKGSITLDIQRKLLDDLPPVIKLNGFSNIPK